MTPCTTSETMFLFHKKANLWLVGCMVTFYNLAAPSTRRGRRRHLKDWRAGRPISPAPLTPLRSATGICDLKGRGEKGRQQLYSAVGVHRAGMRLASATPGQAPLCTTAALLHLPLREGGRGDRSYQPAGPQAAARHRRRRNIVGRLSIWRVAERLSPVTDKQKER